MDDRELIQRLYRIWIECDALNMDNGIIEEFNYLIKEVGRKLKEHRNAIQKQATS